MNNQQLSTRDSITRLEEFMNQMKDKMAPEDFNTEHYFAPGLYARETKFPAGSLVVGHIHREDHLLMLLEGECLVVSIEGTQTLKAPYCTVAKKGIQRAGLARSNCTFITVHATEETNLDELTKQLISPDYKSLEVL